MRYLFAVIASSSRPVEATEHEAEAIDAFNLKIEARGQRLMAVGIAGPDHAKVYDNRHGQASVTNGPVVDSDDFMAGFWILEIGSESEAHELALQASAACNRRIEVRPLLG